MQRETHTQTLAWADKTMSVMQQQQLEACEKRLGQLPAFGLFNGCDDANAEELWRISVDCQEHSRPDCLHSAASLSEAVLRRLPAEAAFLSMPEYALATDLAASDEPLALDDWSDTAPAEVLVRRLWCVVRRDETGWPSLSMPAQIRTALGAVLRSAAHQQVRSCVVRFLVTSFCVLNIYGMVYAEDALAYLRKVCPLYMIPDGEAMAQRLLHTAYDYIYTPRGEMVLLHPGFADPDRHLKSLTHMDFSNHEITDPEADVPQFMLSDAERSAAMRLCGLVEPCLRPECPAPMAVEDLRVLAKQAVGFDTLAEVLGTMLAVRPTRDMLEALRDLQTCTPGFACVQKRTVH